MHETPAQQKISTRTLFASRFSDRTTSFMCLQPTPKTEPLEFGTDEFGAVFSDAVAYGSPNLPGIP